VKTTLAASKTACEGEAAAMSDGGAKTSKEAECSQLGTDLAAKTTEVATLKGTFDTKDTDWQAAETTRLATEKQAVKDEAERVYNEAKTYYDEEKSLYDGLVSEIKYWDDMKLVEPDLYLWKEYDNGSKEAKKRLAELEKTFLPLENKWIKQMNEKFAR
jgi:hypothetical protein